jgi:mono/diheme cytochrome c family protein
MKVQIRVARLALLGAVAVLATACTDPNLYEQRGYRKAPLDQPARIGGGEQPGEISRFGGPRRLETARIELPEQPAVPAAPAQRAAVDLPPGVTVAMVDQGEALYGGAGNCVACHAPNAVGTPLAPALNDPSWIHIDGSFDQLVNIIAQGVAQPVQYPAAMPARGGGNITDEQVREIAAYIYAISRQ